MVQVYASITKIHDNYILQDQSIEHGCIASDGWTRHPYTTIIYAFWLLLYMSSTQITSARLNTAEQLLQSLIYSKFCELYGRLIIFILHVCMSM